jgi:broad specificity phosphatase PhoE
VEVATRIILVRHGQTDWNVERRVQGGGSNPPLNDAGRQQAENIAMRLAHEDVSAIYSTPLQRGRDTARAIARHHGLEVTTEPALREIEAGELEGVTLAELGHHFSQLLVRYDGDRVEYTRAPGGESLPEVQQRGWETVQRLAAANPNQTLVLVSHYFVILSIICTVLELPLAQVGRLRMSTGSISIVSLDGSQARLELFNDTAPAV